MLSENLKRSQPQNPLAFTQTLIKPKLALKIPKETLVRRRGGAGPLFVADGTKESDKERWAEPDDYSLQEILFHSSSVAVKSLRLQTAGRDAVVPPEKSKAGLNNTLIAQNLLARL